MKQLRKRVWVPSACILGGLVLTCLALFLPGPVEGAYKFPFDLCCGDSYAFYYFKTNKVVIRYEENPSANEIGAYFKTNGAWYLRIQGKTNATDHGIEPHLLFIRINDPSKADGSNIVTAWRSFRFWKVRQILDDPEQWKPRPENKK